MASRSPASLFDFGLYFFHNAAELLARGTGPYFYLPKMESHLEARLWNDVFTLREERAWHPARHDQGDGADRDDARRVRDGRDPLRAARPLGGPQLRALGLHLQRDQEAPHTIPTCILPDRAQVTMTAPFLRAYTRAAGQDLPPARRARDGRHGGVHSQSRRDPERERRAALAQVRADKEREATTGFDGTWVAHPGLVPVAKEVFDRRLGGRQPDRGDAGRWRRSWRAT